MMLQRAFRVWAWMYRGGFVRGTTRPRNRLVNPGSFFGSLGRIFSLFETGPDFKIGWREVDLSKHAFVDAAVNVGPGFRAAGWSRRIANPQGSKIQACHAVSRKHTQLLLRAVCADLCCLALGVISMMVLQCPYVAWLFYPDL